MPDIPPALRTITIYSGLWCPLLFMGMIMRVFLMPRVLVSMTAVLLVVGVRMSMTALISRMRVLMTVLMPVIMGMLMGVLMGMLLTPVFVFVGVRMGVLMAMSMVVFVFSG
jgi:hypothetical protein